MAEAQTSTNGIRKALRPIAQRIVNAENRFLVFVRETTGMGEQQAERVLAYYRRHKLVRLDPIGGQFNLTHGDFADADVLRRAAQMAA